MNITGNVLEFEERKNTVQTISNEDFAKLIQDYKLSLYRLARGIVKNEHDIQDAVSATILKAFENLSRLNSTNSFKPWIMKILVNECYSILRKNKRLNLQNNMETLNLTYEDDYHKELMWTIDKLDNDSRTILTLFYYEDMSIREISKILIISEGTVKSRLSRAKAKLKTILGNE